MSNSVRVALVQAAPVVMDIKATVIKAVKLVYEAKEKGAQLVVFPESFIPAYPRGLTFGTNVGARSEKGRIDWCRYYENSVAIPSDSIDALAEAAGKAEVYLTIGVIEKEDKTGTLYCTNLFFGPEGRYLGKHRKLKPSGSERLIWGEGDGSTLTVIDTPYGKMGALMCWENYMPLARAAMYAKGINIYLAPTADSRDAWQSTIQHISLEGRCFVLACNQFVTKDMYPKDLACYDELEDAPEIMCRGGSAILSPLGEYIAGPVYDREDILVADLDLSLIAKGKYDLDVVGHYARTDVFKLIVNEEEQKATL